MPIPRIVYSTSRQLPMAFGWESASTWVEMPPPQHAGWHAITRHGYADLSPPEAQHALLELPSNRADYVEVLQDLGDYPARSPIGTRLPSAEDVPSLKRAAGRWRAVVPFGDERAVRRAACVFESVFVLDPLYDSGSLLYAAWHDPFIRDEHSRRLAEQAAGLVRLGAPPHNGAGHPRSGRPPRHQLTRRAAGPRALAGTSRAALTIHASWRPGRCAWRWCWRTGRTASTRWCAPRAPMSGPACMCCSERGRTSLAWSWLCRRLPSRRSASGATNTRRRCADCGLSCATLRGGGQEMRPERWRWPAPTFPSIRPPAPGSWCSARRPSPSRPCSSAES